MDKTINKLINHSIRGVDIYYHNGNIWLIFTDKKEWVLELEKDGTLWYRFQFFENIFKYLSLNVSGNQRYITKWFEDAVRDGVKNTFSYSKELQFHVEDIVTNGLKTVSTQFVFLPLVEDAIKNGDKY